MERIEKDYGYMLKDKTGVTYYHGGSTDNGVVYKDYEAVMNDMTPKEFADRQLSYGELAVLDEEFDTSFIVDEDCEDDWSDKGLGTNARITYIEERRTGVIDGPEQFDCPPQFVRK